MAYSDNFPAVRPVFQADFANGGRIDPRATFSRASTAFVADGSKHLSSDNLLLQSSDFDTTWANSRLASPTANQTDPAGGTDGYTLTEDSSSGAHRLTQSVTATGDLAFTVFAKQNSGTRYLTLAFFNANNDTVLAVYDLAGGSPVTATGSSSTYTSVSTSQTASGNGYYKCVLKATGTVTLAGVNLNDASTTAGLDTTLARKVYTGDGSSSIDVAFASLSTTGATDYNATTTQIHREYAPSLVSKANNAARFETATDGQSMGCLIESQSTNLMTGSNDFSDSSWTKNNCTASLEAIGPDGQLSAYALRESTGTNTPVLRKAATVSAGTIAFSIYAKLLGNERRLVLREDSVTGDSAVFDLSTGTVAATNVGGAGTIEDVGGGYYRCTLITTPTGSSGYSFGAWLASSTATNYGSYAMDGYSGLLLFGAMVENASFSSSYIDTGTSGGSTATRAADSMSVATSSFYTGGPFTIVSETEGGKGSYPRAWVISDSTNTNRVSVYRNSGAATTSTSWIAYATDGGTAQVSSSISNTAGKLAVSYDTNNVSVCASGGAVTTDTTAVIPGGLNTLKIGVQVNGANNQLNGHVKRVALYNEALSDTNLQALTS